MELNREQAIEILERFDFFQGQRAGRELWNDKPFEVQEQDIANFSRDVALLKNYINELTEENERLKTDLEIRNMKRASIFEIADAFDRGRIKGKADTVRKMQEELKKTISAFCKGDVSEIHRMIDQIAKEMLDER